MIDDLLDTARRAPSAGFSQGIHFVVFSGARCAEFWRITGGEECYAETQAGVMNAPVIVLPFAVAGEYTARYSEPDKIGLGLDKAENWAVPFWITDMSMACRTCCCCSRGVVSAPCTSASAATPTLCTPSSACPRRC